MTFGDGAEGKILGIGNIINSELPKLDNVLLLESLTSNLISIRQLCDQGMYVNFSKSERVVVNICLDRNTLVLMIDKRSPKNNDAKSRKEDSSFQVLDFIFICIRTICK